MTIWDTGGGIVKCEGIGSILNQCSTPATHDVLYFTFFERHLVRVRQCAWHFRLLDEISPVVEVTQLDTGGAL